MITSGFPQTKLHLNKLNNKVYLENKNIHNEQ